MQYEIEITTGTRPARIEALRVTAVSVSDACREARAMTGHRGELRIRYAGLFMPERDAEKLERNGVVS